MAWLERSAADGKILVRVLEVRKNAIWERVGKAGSRGRTGILTTCETAAAAAEQLQALLTVLQSQGWSLIDADAGVDRSFPKSRPPPAPKPGVDDLERALKLAAERLPARFTMETLLATFVKVLEVPRAFRRQAFWFEVHFRQGARVGEVAMCVHVAQTEETYRQLGLIASITVPDERDFPLRDFVNVEGNELAAFASDVRASNAFEALGDCPCGDADCRDELVD